MPYDMITVDQFKAAKPQFKDVPDDDVEMRIVVASRFVDKSWTEGDYQNALIAMTCHIMTLEGLGDSGEAEIMAAGGSRLTSLKSGTLSLTFSQAAATGDEFKDWLNQTACGKFYYMLLMLNRSGPRLLTGGGMGMASGYAKDWPYKFSGIGRG